MARFIQTGDSIDYTPSAEVLSGAVVVLGDLVGVVNRDAAANELTSIAVRGVYEFPKAAGASTGWTPGTLLYWDATNSVATKTSSGNKLIGKATSTVADAATVGPILLTP